jgi:hypothetical protein
MKAFRLFCSGDLVTESGLYAVLHSTPHSLIEHAIHIEGTRFHECRMCPLGVWYRLEAPQVWTSDRMLPCAQAA